ncbi:hypothetical protein J2Z60_001560 [Lactobacillus colini]|uniref:Uncharacterized protein n=1 Tax=Lactobacillus colini TaxID=1819254 RepID=A0ABS4MGD5_9LACO|nr:hypothetical protein [Lactobacillus colini]MBP2058381.1 hypothetical protein [Lactobacillus colini]
MTSEELEYKLYHISNLLVDLCEEHSICTRDYFLIKYNLTSQESSIIDNIFKHIVDNGKAVKLNDFRKMVNSSLNAEFSKKAIEELIIAYRDYFPKAVNQIV